MAETRALTGLQQCNTPNATLLHSPLQQQRNTPPPLGGVALLRCCGREGEKKTATRGSGGPHRCATSGHTRSPSTVAPGCSWPCRWGGITRRARPAARRIEIWVGILAWNTVNRVRALPGVSGCLLRPSARFLGHLVTLPGHFLMRLGLLASLLPFLVGAGRGGGSRAAGRSGPWG